MNHTYRLVWNEAAQRYVPAAESARARGKSGGRKPVTRLSTIVLTAFLGGVYADSTFAAPGGGIVVAGQAAISQARPVSAQPSGGQVTLGNGAITQDSNNTVINQQSQNLAIDWTSFSIGTNESVRFNQPNSSAIALNRVVGQDPSTILGTLSANGQVFILNPNGVLFGKGAEVNVGALVASSLNLSDADFQAGHYQLAAGSSAGTVVNQGNLTAAAGGYLALVGPNVSNNGSMKVTSGTVLLAAGNKVSLQLNNGSLLSYSIDQGAVKALAQNNNLIQADGGRVFLSAKGADAVSKAVVNNTGIIEAQTVDNHDGVIRLLGDSTVGQVNVGGTLDASAPHGGDGGAIETSAAQVKVAADARVTTAAATGKTGTWLVDPTDFTVASSGGDISGATLSSELATTGVTLASSSGTVSGNGDIFVNDAVSWSANTTLTLTAVRNIQINSTITATGNTAGLALNYGSGANYYVNAGGKVTLSGTNPSLSIGGQAYTVINSLGVQNDTTSATLQGMKNNLTGRYALGSDIDASATSGWTANQGLTGLLPIGSTTTAFTGQFAGLGHVISNLTVNYKNNSDVGLFGVTGTASVIRDVGLNGGAVVGTDYVGPLVGFNQGTVLDSYASATGNDQHYLGGLVGENSGTITGSYATGALTSLNKIAGGLVGINNSGGIITSSYATGTVTGVNKMLGGLVGQNLGTITNSYATGSVGGGSQQMGGLVGDNSGSISDSYSTGTVTVSATTSTVGGLLGQNETGGTVTNSFWDKTTSGWTTSAGGTGMTTAQMQTQADFTSATTANGSINPAWDFSSVWQMYSGSTYPLLKGFLKPITITANNASTTYTSAAWNGSDTYTCSIGSCSGLSGTITFGGTAAGAVNVGNYSIIPGGLYSSSQQGYAITFVSGQLAITPANLTITGIAAADKVYDGTLAAILSGTAKVSPLGSDSVTLSGTGAGVFASKNVGGGKAVTVTGYTISGAAAGNYSLVEPVGLTASITPASLVVTGVTAANKVYDATLAEILSGTAKVSPLGSDSVTLSGTGTGVFASKNVGTGKPVTVSGYTLSGADASNYTLVEPTGLTANITPASLSIVGLTANNKVYDATLADTLSGTATVSALGGDSVSLGGTGTAVFASKNVGTGRAVTVSGYTLSGADASNYTLVEPAGLTANITAASLAISGLTANNKVYDATLADTLSGTATVSALGSDSVSLGGTGAAVFASKNVGIGKAVTVSGYTLSGADASNYTLVQPTGLTANITAASLAISGLTATNKVYDATLADTLSGTATVTAFSGDSVSLSGTGTAVFASKNVGSGRAVTVSGYTLSGADAGNYTLVQPAGLTANITAASLAISGLTATNKVYNATLADTLSGTATVSALGSDSVSLGGTGTAVFASKNVGTGRAVTVSGYTLSGADASNYTLVEPTGLTANITPASLSVTGLTANNKVYDATVAATLSGTATVSAYGGDSVSLGGTGTAVFGSKNVGTGKAVTVSGYTLSGADASNYTLVQPIGVAANITPASLSVTGLTATNKVYNATVTDTLSGTATVSAFGGDVVSLGGSGTAVFASKNVGTGKAVTVSGYTLSGADASNYTLVQPTGLTANITVASLAISGLTATNKVYDATLADTLSGTASVSALGSDSVSLGGTGSAAFASKNVGTGRAVTVGGYTLSGADASNYVLVEPTGLTANITAASLAISGLTATNKVYDATLADTLSGTASVSALGSDSVSLGGTGTAVFASKNVGSGKAVTVSGYTLSGADASNYTLVQPTGLAANITPASLNVTGLTANNKVYDATLVDTLSGTATVGAFGGDVVSLGGTGTAVFASKNVGTGKAVTVSGYTLSGADASNYTLVQPTGLTANITVASLAISGLTATNKVYDATLADTLSGTASVSALGSDSVSLGGTGTAVFGSKNVGTGKAVTVSGYTLSGADASNYTLVQPTGLTANITTASLAISGLTANNKVYDATLADTLSGTATVSALGSDSVSLGGTGSAVFGSKNVGTGKAVTVSGYTLSGADASNYTLVQPTGLTANVTAASLAISGLTATNKVYDATLADTLSGTATVSALGSDVVSLGGTGAAVFGSKNVGTGKAVTVSGYTLSGADASNYTLVQPTGLTANITAASLAISGLTATNKVYDATLADTLSGTATVSALGSDVVSLGGAGTAVFGSKNVGTGKAVTVSGYTLSGADASNYTLVQPTGLTANITAASLAITGLTATNKVYDATLADTLSGTATVSALGSDVVSLGGTGAAVFGSKNVGTGKAVTVSGYTLSGADASNYTLVQPTGLTANITAASLAISGLTASNKVYDATLADTLSGTATVSALGSDVVSLGGTGTAVFGSKNVGTGKAVTVSGYTLSGADASNYTLVQPTGLTANITAASLAISGLTATNKVYDATLADTLSGTATVTALGSDVVSLGGTGAAVFGSKNVGTGKAVTVSGYTLSGADASNYTLVQPTGLTANITAASLAITGLTATNKVYDATLADTLSGTATVSALGSDVVSLGGTGAAVFGSKNVGTGKAVTVSGYTLSGADASNYTLVQPTGLTANITAASLAITGLTATNKVYDATLADTLSGTATVSALGSDVVSLGGTGAAVFGSKNVGTGKAVTVSGYTLSGADASNYTLVQPTGLTANITAASLAISGLTATNKVYDATLADTLSGTATVSALGNDVVSLGGAGTAVFGSKNVGTGKAVTVSGYTLSGADASNYTLVQPTGLTANITAASLAVSGLTATNKVYDATLADTLSGTATVSALGNDVVSLGGAGTAVFGSKNVGTGKAVTVSGYTLSGADASNYTLVQPTGLTANITAASLAISGLTATNKVYDATLADTLSGTATVSALGSDVVSLGGAGTAVFGSKNVGTGKAVTVSGYTLSGADASNYTLVQPTGLTANVTAASLAISGLTATNKVYDATLADTLSGTATVSALGSDVVSLGGTGSAVFGSKNVGTGKAVTVSGYTLSGADASNYTLVQPTGLTANITAASLAVSGLTATNKVYDATLADTLSGTATVSALGNDVVSLGGAGTAVFGSKNVGTGKAVTVSGYTLSGADASNYTLVQPTGLTANITAASLAISGLTATNKVYDATLADTLSGTATVSALGSDVVSLGGAGTAVFGSKNVGTGKAVTVSGYTLSGADASNYTLVQPTGLTANVTAASLAISGLTATNKVYDATLADTLSGTATVTALGSDVVSLGGTGAAVFGSKNVGTGKAVTVSGYTLSGADASNYTLVQPTGLTANITAASLAISGLTATNKVYDATLADTLSGTATVSALGSDVVSLGGAGTAVFGSKNVGTGKAVTVSGYTLSGADASNYTLVQPTGLTANITAASLAISGLTATNKVYDATLADTLSGTATVSALGSDVISLGGTGSAVFGSKNVGTGKAVTVSGYTLTGADASNYTLVQPTGLTANITAASLAISGLTATNKVYDATLTDTLSGTATVSALGSDVVSLGGTGTAVFGSKNVGTGKAVTVSGYTLTGVDASNYTLVQPTGLTANITAASLAISGLTATNKVYDATLADTLSGTATVSALGSDVVSLGGAGTAVFGSKNVGTGKAVTVSGYTLSGADASNYTLVQPTGLTANITAASLAISGLTATNKVYDATLADTLSGTATVSALGSDVISLGGTGSAVFGSKNVGTGKAVTVSGYTLTGADASNYTLVQPTGLTANITAASLAVSGLTATNKVYDATLADTLSGTATVSALGSDVVSLGGAGTAVFGSKNVGTGKAVTVSGYTLSGADASNYTLVQPTGLTANITAASLAISGLTATNKVYDATLADTLSGTATVSALGSDVVSLGGAGTAVFGSKNVGTGKAVTVSGYTLSGADASNYTLVQPTGLTANITAASLAITGLTATNKVYDATLADTLSGTATVSALGNDVVSLGGTGSAAFASKNVGTGKAVMVSGYTLSGADASNYTLVQPTGLTANITAASLAISGLTATNKVYDATLADTLSGTATVSALGSDVVSLGGAGSAVFGSKNVGTGKAVTVSGYTLSGADASNYTLVQPTGLTANVTAASLAITGLSANNKVYDATAAAALSGAPSVAALGTDSVAIGGTGSGVFSDKNVGANKAVTVAGYTLSGPDAGNYTLLQPTGLTANISPANLAIGGLVANNKVYDGTASATVSGTAGVVALGTDSLSLSGTSSTVFADKNVGSGKVVTVSGYSLTGADAGNYVLVQPAGLTANISPASLVVSGVTASSKVYDATISATLNGSASITPFSGDHVALSGTGNGAFGDKNVGTSKTVTVSGYALTGADAGNYTLVEPTGLTAGITPARLAVTGVAANNKVYDSTVTATLSGTATVTAIGSDNVVLSGTGSGSFVNKNVGNNNAVAVSGYSLSGGDAGNYTLVEPTGLSANITPASLVLGGISANNKVYDATAAATLSGTATFSALGSDVVSVVGTGAGVFASKSVGTGKAVTVSGYTLSGADAGNYTLIEPTGLSANISPANLLISGITASNKVYDATVAATLSGTGTVTPLGSDSVNLGGTGSGVFASKNVGTGKAVTVSGFTLSGADAGNYNLVEPIALTANITPANLAITGLAANNKVYDGTVTATLSGTAIVAALGSDSVVLNGSGSGSFADKNVGNNKAVTVSGYSLNGADAANYTLIEPIGLSANITPANLLISGIAANNKVYDTTLAASLSGTAMVAALGNDNVSLSGTSSAVFANKNVGSDKAVTVSGYSLSGPDAGNYTLIEPAGLSANISPANLLISGITASNKVYDATAAATLGGTATVTALGSDSVTLGGMGGGVFASKNVGTGKAVTVTGFTLSGADAGNYNLVEPTGLTANITPANLTITGLAASNKVYDGAITGTLSGTATVAALGSDSIVLNGTGSGSFADKNVGNNKAVTVSGYSLSGADAPNYTLIEPAGLSANITPANLLISGVAANNKVYDTTVAATLSGAATITPLSNDTVALSGTRIAVFSDKNAGLDKTVTVSGYTLSGADAGNYTLVEPTGLTANISPANLIVSGVTGSNKVYDGTVTATLAGTAFVSPLGNDTAILTGTGSGTFVGKNVGTNKTVNISGYALSGADAANYTLVEPTNVMANVTARPLTISATGINKVYDGSTNAAVTLTDNRVTGDALATGYNSAAFGDANVGTGKAIGVGGISLSGADAGNYIFNTSAATTANITAASLTVAANAATKIYDGLAYSGGNGVTFTGFVAGETPSVLGGTLTYGGSSQGASNVGSYAIVPGGLTSSNYIIAFVNGTLTITPAALAAAINSTRALYDATSTLLQ